MKKAGLLFVSCLVSSYASSAGIYKCVDSNGKTTFSGVPCPASSKSAETLRPEITVTSEETVALDGDFTTIKVSTASDMKKFAQGFSSESMSDVIRGVFRASFHGLDIEEIFKAKDVHYEYWNTGTENVEYLVHVENGYKLFSVAKSVYVDGRKDHEFLDLQNEKIVSTMASKGFGEPKMRDLDEYEWQWSDSGLNCSFHYSRNPFNPEKFFQYSCERK